MPSDLSDMSSLFSLCDVVTPTNDYYMYQVPFMIAEKSKSYNETNFIINSSTIGVSSYDENGNGVFLDLFIYDFETKTMSGDLNLLGIQDLKIVVPSDSNLYNLFPMLQGLQYGFTDDILNKLNNDYFLINQILIPVDESQITTHTFSSNWTKEQVQFGNTLLSNLNGIYKYKINPNFVEEFNTLDDTTKDLIFPQNVTNADDYNMRMENIGTFMFGPNILPSSIDDMYHFYSSDVSLYKKSTNTLINTGRYEINSHVTALSGGYVENLDVVLRYYDPSNDYVDIQLFQYSISTRTMRAYDFDSDIYLLLPNNVNIYFFLPLYYYLSVLGYESEVPEEEIEGFNYFYMVVPRRMTEQ